MKIGDTVKAKIQMVNDLRDDGLGIQICAHKGDELIVRGKSEFSDDVFYVSHKHITDRSFCAKAVELELINSN